MMTSQMVNSLSTKTDNYLSTDQDQLKNVSIYIYINL